MHTNETTGQRSVIFMNGHVWFTGAIGNSAHRSTLSGKSRANCWATIPPKLSPTMLAPPLIPACKSDRKPRRGQQCKYDGASNELPLQAQVHSSPYPLAVVLTVTTAITALGSSQNLVCLVHHQAQISKNLPATIHSFGLRFTPSPNNARFGQAPSS